VCSRILVSADIALLVAPVAAAPLMQGAMTRQLA